LQKTQALQKISTVNNAAISKYNHVRGQTEIEEKKKHNIEEEV